ncbi:MAG: hypothetical protein Q7Q73_00595 [Verrucomicrobiota bacterium JB024]|nr:hypothetical protein [Verrucomicrobiota bacterium JB024]
MDLFLLACSYLLICGAVGGLCLWLMGKLARLGITFSGMFMAALATHLTAFGGLLAGAYLYPFGMLTVAVVSANIVLFLMLRKFTGGSLLPRIVVIVLLYNAVLYTFTWVLIAPAGCAN